MMTFLLFAPASTRWLGWRKDRKSRRDRLDRLCDIYCQSYFVLLRFISDRHSVEKLTFFKFVDQKPLVKRRWSYNGAYKHFDILPDTKSKIFHRQTLFLSHWSIGGPTSSLHERGRDSSCDDVQKLFCAAEANSSIPLTSWETLWMQHSAVEMV